MDDENASPKSAPETGEDKPRLSRELKAVLKLLAKKGILTPKEYLDEFNNTD